jgi:LPS-assembly lipoprotein
MSSLDRSRRVTRRLGLLAALSLSLTGCLQPLYGPTASGLPLQTVLAAVEVDPIAVPGNQQRLSHYLRSELVYDLDGSGQPQPKRYRLAVSVTTTVQSPIVDTTFGRANASTLLGEATYTLVPIAGGAPIASGRVVGSASYERSPQRFAVVRAQRDAEIRLAKLLSEQIRNKLALSLRTAS